MAELTGQSTPLAVEKKLSGLSTDKARIHRDMIVYFHQSRQIEIYSERKLIAYHAHTHTNARNFHPSRPLCVEITLNEA